MSMLDYESIHGDTNLAVKQRKRRLLYQFLPWAWIGHFGIGMTVGIIGPSQPYLSSKFSVHLDTINFLWTSKSIGCLLTTFLTSFLLEYNINSANIKRLILSVSQLICGVFLFLSSIASSFPLFLIFIFIYGSGLGMFDTSDNSLIVSIYGSIESRPFTQSLHAFVGLGFVAGSLMMGILLPDTPQEANLQCHRGPIDYLDGVQYLSDISSMHNLSLGITNKTKYENNLTLLDANLSSVSNDLTKNENFNRNHQILGIDLQIWPFVFTSIWHAFGAIGFIFFVKKNLLKPLQVWMAKNFIDSKKNPKNGKCFLAALFLFYIFSCGIEGIFQAMIYTFGLCGPPRLSAKAAAALSTTYYFAFVTGRCSGIFISRYIHPRNLIKCSLLGCLISSSILCSSAHISPISLYMGTGLMGFSVSFQFASGISWTAENFDVTGKLSSLFFLGGNIGSLVFPPLVGVIFTLHPMGLFYTAFVCILFQTVLVTTMMLVLDIKIQNINQENINGTLENSNEKK